MSKILTTKSLRTLLTLLCFVFVSQLAKAQLDTRHYIPPVVWSHAPTSNMSLMLSTLSFDQVSVTVRQGDGTLITVVTIDRNNPISIDLGAVTDPTTPGVIDGSANITTGLIYTDKGLLVEASSPIFANLRKRASNNMYSVTGKGDEGLGRRFRTGHYVESRNNSTDNPSHAFTVMATEDITEIVIEADTNVIFENSNGGFTRVGNYQYDTVTLNAGEVFAWTTNAVDSANYQINGTLITSDKDIAVVTGTSAVWTLTGGCGEGGYDALVPIEQMGKDFFITRSNGDIIEFAIVVADSAGTNVFVDGALMATLNEGETYRVSYNTALPGETRYIQTSRGAYVYQSSGGGCEYGFSLIPPVPCLGTREVIFQDFDAGYRVMVVYRAGGSLILNGVDITPAVPNLVVGNTDWASHTFTRGGGSGVFQLRSDSTIILGATPNAGGGGAFGYFSGFDDVFAVAGAARTFVEFETTFPGYVQFNIDGPYDSTIIVRAPTNGTMVITGSTTDSLLYEYTPDLGFIGIDTVILRVCKEFNCAGEDKLECVDVQIIFDVNCTVGNVGNEDFILWLKADDGPNTSTDGSTFDVWFDRGIESRHALQYTLGTNPTYNTNVVNNFPAIRFDGTQTLQMQDLVSGDKTFFTVLNAFEYENYLSWTAGNDSLNFHNGSDAVANSGDASTLNTGLINGTGWHIAELKIAHNTANGVQTYLDGTLISQTTWADSLDLLTGGFLGSASGLRFMNGYIAEMVAYDRVLNAVESKDIETYLALKYGMTLAMPYTVEGADVYNHAGYENNIAGLGVDFSMCLDLLESGSINAGEPLRVESPGLNNANFLIWGDDGFPAAASATVGVPEPATYDERLRRTWRVESVGLPGAVTLKFYLPLLGSRPKDPNDYALFVDDDTDFTADATKYTGAISNDTLYFTGVTFNDDDFFTLAVPSLCAPGGVDTNIAIWLRADEGTGSSTDGDGLSYWYDRREYGFHGIQLAANKPVYNANVLNGFPTITFNGGANYFNLLLDSLYGKDYTLFAVSQRENSNTNQYVLGSQSTTANQGLEFGYRNNTAATISHSDIDLDLTTTGFDDAFEIPTILVAELNSGAGSRTITEYKIGAALTTTDANTTSLSGTAQGVIGRGTGANGLAGEIAEIIVYNGNLSAAEIRDVNSYLALKYGLTIPVPYTASGVNIYNNATYNNNIAGIGFAFTQCFNLQNSMTSNEEPIIRIQSPSDLENGEYLVWGHNGAASRQSTPNSGTNDLPAVYEEILDRVWYTEETGGDGDVGTVTVKIPLGNLGGRPITDPTKYALLMSPDTDFETGVNIHTTGRTIVGDTLVFTLANFTAGQFFTLAVPKLCVPGDVSVNWVLWLKANEGVSTNVDGAPVSDWFDRSVFGTHARQSGPNKPTYLADFSNGYPAVTFNGGANYFDVDLSNIKNQQYTIFSVAQRTAGGADNHLLGTTSAAANEGLEFGYESNIGLRLGHISNQVDATVPGFNAPSIQPVLLVGSLATGVGKTVSEYKNGIKTTATNTNDSQLTGTAAGVLGRGNGTAGFGGQIAEMIVYNGVITPVQIRDVESYLALKYGMTIPLPYTASGSNIYNFASYANDITGIGEDDDQCFYQPASSSISSSAVTRMENPSGMTNDEYLIWGHNGITASQSSLFNVGGYEATLDRIWQVDKTGDVGSITVKFYLPALGSRNITDANEYALLIDTDTDFTAGATFHTTGRTIVGDTLTFTLVNFSDANFFTLAVPTASCAPGDAFSNLYRWMKANEGTSTSVNGAPVDEWRDGNGVLRARQYTAAQQPTFVNVWKNNNPAILFDGNDDYFEAIFTGLNNSSYTIFTAVERIDDENNNYILGNNNSGSNTTSGHLHFGYRNNTQITFAQYGDDLSQNVDPYNLPEQTASIVSGWLDLSQGKNIKEIKSGNETFRSNTDTDALNSTERGEIGRALGNREFHGYIGEVIIFTDTVPASVRRDIETYLAIKYGITMNVATQGYTADGATIYNNVSYDNNIAGIALNASQCLYQPSSMSINSDAVVRVENPSNLDDGEYFIWGHNGVDANNSVAVGVPAGYDEVLQRVWSAGILGDVGTTTMKFYLPSLGARPKIESEYALMIDTDTDFSTGATIHTIGRSIVGDTLIFTNVNIGDGNFFTLAVPEICAPGDVANNLNTWFKADEGTSSITNGADVAIWYDRTRNGNHATAGINQPTYNDARFNGYPALTFNGGTDFYNFSLTGIKGSSYTLFAVGERSNGNNNNYFLGTDSLTNNEGLFLGYGTNTTVTLDHTGNGIAAAVNPYTVDRETPVLLLGEFNAGTGKTLIEYKEGVATTATDADLTPLTGNASGVLGRGNGTAGLNGDMSEVIVYSGVLNASDRRDVESYLAVKYSITLPIPYTASGVNIYNNTGYESDIIGIGQDLTQCFDQPNTKTEGYTGISSIQNPSDLGDGEYLIFGHNGVDSRLSTTTGVPAGYDEIMQRIWQVDTTGNVGTVTLKFDLTKMGVRPRVATDYALLIDTDTDFTNATEHIIGRSIVGDTLIFTGVSFADFSYFTIALPEEGCAPGDAQDNLLIWLKGDVGTSSTVDGATVTTWADQSINTYDVTQVNATERPDYKANWRNGNAAINFNGNTEHFEFPEMSNLAGSNYTIFAAVERTTDKGNNYILGSTTTNTGDRDLHFGYRNNTQTTLAHWGDDVTDNVLAHNDPEITPTIVSGWLGSGSKTIKEIKSGVELEAVDGTSGTLTIVDGEIGRMGGGRNFVGQIGEIIIYTEALTATQRRDIETYLAIKYGITMDISTRSYTADGLNLYTHTAYANDIAGLASNNSQCFVQDTAVSANGDAVVSFHSPSDLGNGEYLMFGNNNGALDWQSTGSPFPYMRMNREWRVQETGDVGAISISIDISSLPTVGTPTAADFAILFDSDTDLSDGSSSVGVSIVGNVVTFTGIDLSNGDRFTIGYTPPIRLHSGAAATPNDEAETATGGSCVDNVAANSGWNIFTDASGSVIFAIEPSGNNLGCINWGVRTLDNPVMRRRTNGGDPDTYLMNRNLWIEVENQPDPTDPVTLRMFALTDEINDLLLDAQAGGYATTATFASFLADSLRMEKFDSTVVNVDPADNVGSGGTIVAYNPGEVVYRNALHGYYLEVSITEFSEFIPYYRPEDPITPLPVELLYFSGKPVGEEVELTWATATELNNDYFVVERSANGKDFYPIFEVDGRGTTKARTNYLDYDTEPLAGKSYYRLKQVDFDGTFAYSRIVEIDMTLAKSIDLFPNPADADFSLRFNGYAPDSEVKVTITTASGKLIGTRIGSFDNNRLLQFKSSDLELPSGVYVLEIQVGNHQEVKRLVVK